MDESIYKILPGLIGAAVGALIAAAANIYAANRKIKEIELAYTYKLQEGYLENARKFVGDVYVPINILLTNLSNSYDSFRARVDFKANTVPDGSHNFFVGQCRNYLSEIDHLMKRGADAYLTTALDTCLREFNSFIRESIGTTEPIVKVIFETEASLFLFRTGMQRIERTLRSPAALDTPPFSFRFGGLAVGYSNETLAAPLKSRAFEKRFQTDITTLKSLIKEVTLGSHSRTS